MNPAIIGAAKSWTMWFAIALTFFGFLQTQSAEIEKLVTPQTMGWFNIAIGAIVATLRVVTTTSLAEKGGGAGDSNAG